MALHFITFSGGLFSTSRGANRLVQDINSTERFRSVSHIKIRELLRSESIFATEVIKKFLIDPKGFGYWSWKSLVIRKKLEEIESNDLLIYTDAGCDIADLDRFSSQIDSLASIDFDLLITLQSRASYLTKKYGVAESTWTKKSLLDQLALTEDQQVSPQYAATALIIRKNDKTLDFVREWQRLCFLGGFRLLDDRESILEEEFAGLQEHRHDQSILSCLVKVNTLMRIKVAEQATSDYSILNGLFLPSRNHSSIPVRHSSFQSVVRRRVYNRIYSIEKRLNKNKWYRIISKYF
jgi:hypothetical protein